MSVAEELIRRRPEQFPLREPFGLTVLFGGTTPDFDGYGSTDPIIEILVDVGMIEDERLGDWERVLQDATAGEKYTVTLQPVSS